MWGGHSGPPLPLLSTGLWRERETCTDPIRASATLIPSAEVPLITPATIMEFFKIAPAAYPLDG
jgi:hypothetical protein